MEVNINQSWKKVLREEFDKPYFENIVQFLKSDRATAQIFPPGSLIFSAFEQTPFDDVKVVILGQDPYHGKGQAHGLSFSVPNQIKPPPSLVNIFKEIKSDIGIEMPPLFGDLTNWAKQGVLLLNASLTVRSGEPGSHSKIGWLTFTDAVIKKISDEKENIIFILWGAYAQQKIALIDTGKHHILKSVHPSPFSVEKGFFGCKHFSKTNELLISLGKDPIDWQIKKD